MGRSHRSKSAEHDRRLEPRSLIFSPDGKRLWWASVGTWTCWIRPPSKKFTSPGLLVVRPIWCSALTGSSSATNSARRANQGVGLATHEELLQLPVGSQGGFGRKLQFSPDGTRLMVQINDPSGLALDTVRVYVLPTEDIIRWRSRG